MRICLILCTMACCVVLVPSFAEAGEIHDAIEAGDVAAVQQLLSNDKLHANAASDNGTSPLTLAVQNGATEITDILLGAGAEVDAKDARDFSPLFWSVINGNRAIAELLVSRGADVTFSHPVFGSVADFAFQMECQKGLSGLTDLLISHGAAFDPSGAGPRGLTRLRVAVMLGSEDMVRWLIEKKADVNSVSPRDGSTALRWAASKGHLVIANSLIEAGADVNRADSLGVSPIRAAIENGHAEMVSRLVEAGAKLDSHDPTTGQTLLHLATLYGHRGIVETLLAAGADPRAIDSVGKTPSDYACRYGNQRVANLLTQKGAEQKKCADRSGQEVGEKEALAWRLSNRGWAIRTQKHLLVFDAEEFGVSRPTEPSLANGFVTPRELKGQNVVALYSCYHGEVGEPAYIHEIEDSLSNIVYVHNQDDPWRGSRNAIYLGPNQTSEVSGIKLHTITPITNMPLLNYLCEVDGLVVYYANQATDDLVKYRADLDSLAQRVDHVDLALLPIDDYQADSDSDLRAFVARFKPKAVILTDANHRLDQLAAAANELKVSHPEISVYYATYPGDHVRYERGRLIEYPVALIR